jgi:hypothetical protein
MKARTSRRTRDEANLISMAGSIGSTLGVIAGKAHAIQKALSGSIVRGKAKRDGGKLVKKTKSAKRKTARRSSSHASSFADRSAGRTRSKV